MAPLQGTTVKQLKLHVKLKAPGPDERCVVLGSHEALGCWNPRSGLQLAWKGTAWETPDPIAISPCERVEFKFVRLSFNEVEWENGPNRVTEFPNFKGELCLQGVFNGETILQPNDPDLEVPPENSTSGMEVVHDEAAELWKQLYEKALSVLVALQVAITSRQEENELRRARHHQVVSDLRQQINESQNEAALLQSSLAPVISSVPSPSFASAIAASSSFPSLASSSQLVAGRSVGMSSSSNLMRRNPSMHLKSRRMDIQGKVTQVTTSMAKSSAPAPPRGPVGRLSSVLETMPNVSRESRASPGQPARPRQSKRALRNSRGSSSASPPSEEEAVRHPARSGQQRASTRVSVRTANISIHWSEGFQRGTQSENEPVSSAGAGHEAPIDDLEGINFAWKEVVAALSAKTRFDEVGSSEDSAR